MINLYKQIHLVLGIVLLSMLAVGCSSFVKSKPVDKSEAGIEYTLCLPVLVADPQPDGRVEFTTTCLPDPERRYVISGSTFLGNLTLNVKRNDNMTLEEVTIDPNNAAVMAETIKAAGEIKKKKLEVKAAAEKVKIEAEKAALDEAKSEEEEAQKNHQFAITALAEAESELQQENKKLNTLLLLYGWSDSNAETIIADTSKDIEVRKTVRNAYITVKEKEAALESAKAALETAEKAWSEAQKKHISLASSGNVFNTISGNTPPNFNRAGSQVWGPLMYRLEQTVNDKKELESVRLVAMFEQQQLKTLAVDPPQPPKKIKATLSGFENQDDGSYVLTIAFNKKVDSLNAGYTFLQNIDTFKKVGFQKISEAEDKKGAILVTPTVFAAGKYRVILQVKIGGDTQDLRDLMIERPQEGP